MLEPGICVLMLVVLGHYLRFFYLLSSCVMLETFSAYILKSYLLLQKAGSLFKWIQLFYAINGWLLEYN